MREFTKNRLFGKAVCAAAACIMLLLFAGSAFAAEYTASEMRLASTQGNVKVTSRNGRSMTIVKDLKLMNGNEVGTEAASYAWISMDREKLAKMDAMSNVSVSSNGRNLLLLLNKGNLYFNVSSPLKGDETLKIRTSTMVTGIRGTIGIIRKPDPWHEQVAVLEGQVECEVTDPVSGQTKEIKIPAGYIADFYVYEQPKNGDKCDIFMRKLTEADIDGFAAMELRTDADAASRAGKSGLDIGSITDGAPAKLLADESAMAARLAAQPGKLTPETGGHVHPVFPNQTAEPLPVPEYKGIYVMPFARGGRSSSSGSSSAEPPAASANCNHNWVQEAYTAATCTAAGYSKMRCTICGEVSEGEIPALGHDWVEAYPGSHGYYMGVVRVEYKCNRCGETKIESFDPDTYSGHVWSGNTCTVCGYTKP